MANPMPSDPPVTSTVLPACDSSGRRGEMAGYGFVVEGLVRVRPAEPGVAMVLTVQVCLCVCALRACVGQMPCLVITYWRESCPGGLVGRWAFVLVYLYTTYTTSSLRPLHPVLSWSSFDICPRLS